MPIYEYQCNGCGERHEFIQKFSDRPKRKCPACGKSRLRKLVSAAAFHLKGNGWYVTDFRDKKKSEDKAESKVESKKNGTGDGAGSASTGGKDSKASSSDTQSSASKDGAGKSKSSSAQT